MNLVHTLRHNGDLLTNEAAEEITQLRKALSELPDPEEYSMFGSAGVDGPHYLYESMMEWRNKWWPIVPRKEVL